MTGLDFTIIAAGLLLFTLVSKRLGQSILTPPMLFSIFGLLISSYALDLVTIDVEHGAIHTLAELTLILVLFADATRIDLSSLRREQNLPARMLLIGLPLAIVLGAAVALPLFANFGVWSAAVLATMLAPTDAALGQVVVSSPRVPMRIRQTLNVESGLNDGIVLPVLIVLLSLAGATEAQQSAGELVRFGLLQITLGPLVGVLVGYAGGWLIRFSVRRDWITHEAQEISAVALAVLAFGGAEVVGGNGFIAAFSAGLVLGNWFPAICQRLYDFAETEGHLLTLFVFLIFGAVLLPESLAVLTGATLLYAMLSLTLIRMIPIAISLLGVGLRWETVAFLGWFGPRGLATILFGLLVLDESSLLQRGEITWIAMTTVCLSILTHGLTAYPLASWYGRRMETMPAEETPERQAANHMPLPMGMTD